MSILAGPPSAMLNALSIDLEEWFHAELVRPHVDADWPERRAAWAVEPILELLARYDVRATFFVVGDIMRHDAELVRRIHGAGHEIGCHGWSHRTLWSLDPGRFADELAMFDRDAAAVMPVEEIIGFRAPTFSLDERTSWALALLRSHGYRYDSSVFPMKTDLYGVSGAPLEAYRPEGPNLLCDQVDGDLVELPMSVLHWAGFRIPVSGGVYMRAMPWFIWSRLLRMVNDRGRPFVIYAHPWECDVETPRVQGISPLYSFATYLNLHTTLSKLERLLQTFDLGPIRDVIGVPHSRSMQKVAS